MKFNILVLILAGSFCTSVNAAYCNTLMGGCPLDDNLATSDHMRSQIQNRVLPKTNTPAASTAASTGKTSNALTSKKATGQTSIMQTISKTIVK